MGRNLGRGGAEKVKIALGHKIQHGPWGGGNRFASALAKALKDQGFDVVHSLTDPDISLILMVDPRARNPSVAFTPGEIFRYLVRHPETLVLHRINECDERKGTRGMNFRLKLANYVADHTVFIGSWLVDLDLWRRESDFSVVLNGADGTIFHSRAYRPWNRNEPFALVTHHWGAHAFKGFDVYRHLDDLLERSDWQGRLSFTYIGNLPEGISLRHVRHVPPLDGKALVDELGRHHVYVTASINEPAGMHHIEGALCGLPLLYRDSGALPEYCQGFGEKFTGPDDVEDALACMVRNYETHLAAMQGYGRRSDRMCLDYLRVIEWMLENRERLTKVRRLWRSPLAASLIQLPF